MAQSHFSGRYFGVLLMGFLVGCMVPPQPDAPSTSIQASEKPPSATANEISQAPLLTSPTKADKQKTETAAQSSQQNAADASALQATDPRLLALRDMRPENLYGMGLVEVMQLLGPPDRLMREGSIEIWRYGQGYADIAAQEDTRPKPSEGKCHLALYFYPQSPQQEGPQVYYAETYSDRLTKQGFRECLARLMMRYIS